MIKINWPLLKQHLKNSIKAAPSDAAWVREKGLKSSLPFRTLLDFEEEEGNPFPKISLKSFVFACSLIPEEDKGKIFL